MWSPRYTSCLRKLTLPKPVMVIHAENAVGKKLRVSCGEKIVSISGAWHFSEKYLPVCLWRESGQANGRRQKDPLGAGAIPWHQAGLLHSGYLVMLQLLL